MISYLGSLVQFSPAAGRAGRCRQTSLCVGSAHRVPATLGLPRTGVSVPSPSILLRLLAALYGASPVLSAVPVFGSSTKAQIRLRLRVVFPGHSGSGSQGLARVLPGAVCLFPLRRAAMAPRGLAPSPRVRRAFSLRGERPGQPEAWRSLHGHAAPFPSAAPGRAAGRVSGSLQTGAGACLPGGRGWLLWG